MLSNSFRNLSCRRNGKPYYYLFRQFALAVVLACTFQACSGSTPTETKPPQAEKSKGEPKQIREAAVAGLFYPKEEAALSQMLEGLLASAPVNTNASLKALICPHAGYRYSGLTAAYSYKSLLGRRYETVVVLAPSHYALFSGASISSADAYRTPLGLALISEKARQWAKLSPFVPERRCVVQRPQWWSEAPKAAPPTGDDTPDTWEHSAEVQIPFLQKTLKNFSLVPVVIGQADAAQIARVLSEKLDDKTLLVASSDLSHYHPYDEAKQLDGHCVKAICDLNIEQMQSEEACGKLPILAVMHIARQKGWKPQLLDYRNSGDTAGDKHGVVGYAAIAFYGQDQQNYSAMDRQQLLALARKTLKEVVTTGSLPKSDESGLAKRLGEPKGCFVTLTKNGALRGCIGHIFPQTSLYKAVMENARSAAMRDPRFNPVQPEELDKIEVEVSVLTVPEPLKFSSPDELLNKLQPHKDGVVLKIGPNGATYLPQVWEQLPDKVEFLNNLSQKAGCPPSAWRNPGATVLIYHVEAFKESDLKAAEVKP